MFVGKGLGEFKRARTTFKRTWEYEVELDSKKPALPAGQKSHVGSDALSEGGPTSADVYTEELAVDPRSPAATGGPSRAHLPAHRARAAKL